MENFKNLIALMTSQLEDVELTPKERLEYFFDDYFSKKEGHFCSFDKTLFVMTRMIRDRHEKRELPLQETYRDIKNRGGSIGQITELDEICYWCPTSFKNTTEAWSWFNTSASDEFKETMNLLIEGDLK